MQQDEYALIGYRIEAEIKHFDGVLPDNVIAIWFGYLAAVYEHKILSLDQYRTLRATLPPLQNDPTGDLFLGRHSDEDE